MDTSKHTSKIIDAIGRAIQENPKAFDFIDWNDLGSEWDEFVEDIFNRGVLTGLQIAKKAWDKGLGRSEIRENEIYYQELIEEE